MKLVDNWKDCWKMWTIRFNTFIGLLILVLAQFPDIFLSLWALIPEDIKQNITSIEGASTAFVIILIISSIARLIKQEKLHINKENKEE